MGMFDTVIFEKPIICKCGQKIESTQIKELCEEVVLDKVQQWLDERSVELKVCLSKK